MLRRNQHLNTTQLKERNGDKKMIERFSKNAGQYAMTSQDDQTMILLGNPVPDYVTLPPELGGGDRPVKDTFVGDCPITGTPCRHLNLGEFNGKTLYVAESTQFFWYTK
jgi:hypothetical protein